MALEDSIHRGKKIVVSGDTKQLPPPPKFNNVDLEIEDFFLNMHFMVERLI